MSRQGTRPRPEAEKSATASHWARKIGKIPFMFAGHSRAMDTPQQHAPAGTLEDRILNCPGVRHGLFAVGGLSVAIGTVGLFVPLVPSTVFFLAALWAFSKSSVRFHAWLYNHPRLGRALGDWHSHRVIPLYAKVLAVATMAASLLIVTVFVAEDWVLPVCLGASMSLIAAYILTRSHKLVPAEIDR